jgi:hypothetical protein
LSLAEAAENAERKKSFNFLSDNERPQVFSAGLKGRRQLGNPTVPGRRGRRKSFGGFNGSETGFHKKGRAISDEPIALRVEKVLTFIPLPGRI